MFSSAVSKLYRNNRIMSYGSLIVIIILQLFYSFYVFTVGNDLLYVVLFSVIFVAFVIFFIQYTDSARLALLVGTSIASPMVSFPYEYIVPATSGLVNNLFVPYDRIQPRNILVTLFLIFFFLKFFFNGRGAKIIYSSMFFAIVLLIVFMSHDYNGLSVYQAIVDFVYLVSAFLVFVYMRSYVTYRDLDLLREMFFAIIMVKSLIVILDLIISFSGVVSWSVSYRGGVQGVFYGMELLFAMSVGIVFVYLHSLYKSGLIKFMVALLGCFLLYKTNIKFSYIAYIVTLLIVSDYFLHHMNNVIVVALMSVGMAAFVFFIQLIGAGGSIGPRLGSYISGLSVLFDGNFFTGVMPGIIDINNMPNLSAVIAKMDYGPYLLSISDNLFGNLHRRNEMGIGIIPHNAAISMLVSYGAIVFIPVFYYFIYMPVKIIISWRSHVRGDDIFMVGILFFILILSLSHSIIMMIEIVFLVEYIRLRAAVYGMPGSKMERPHCQLC